MLDQCLQLILKKYPTVLSVYAFGTILTEYFTKDSDIDLAIYPTEPIDTFQLWSFAQEIASQLDRDIDLIDLTKASVVFRHEIISTGQRIYCKDQGECDYLEGLFLSMYVRFNEERKDILKDFLDSA